MRFPFEEPTLEIRTEEYAQEIFFFSGIVTACYGLARAELPELQMAVQAGLHRPCGPVWPIFPPPYH